MILMCSGSHDKVYNADDKKGFLAYKKLRGHAIATLFIPADAMVRIRVPVKGSECILDGDYKSRASYAIVKAIEEADGSYSEVGFSKFKPAAVYVVGEEFVPDDFDESANACTNGVHFFLDRKHAERY